MMPAWSSSATAPKLADQASARVAAEDPAYEDVAEHPVHRKDGKERNPDQPRRGAGEVGQGNRAKDEERDGNRENEVGERLATLLAKEPQARGGIADRNQAEDRQDDGDHLFHLYLAGR